MSAPKMACLPMRVECLVMTDHVAEDENVKVAPIAQPNYTFLRLDKEMGVYVSWTMPRAYRMGTAGTQTATPPDQRQREGYQPIGPGAKADYSAPDFRPVPTRWLIMRYLDLATLMPQNIPDSPKAKLQFRGWVLDSDRLSLLEDIPLMTPDGTREVDLQTDFSPFVKAERENSTSSIQQQAEVFVGYKTAVESWSEDLSRPAVPMSLLNSSNRLFADYQPHNSNVFSMIDEMTYLDNSGVIAWQADDNSADILCHGSMYDVLWSITGSIPDTTAQAAAQTVAEACPVSIGTSAADALLTLVKAHVDDDTGALKELETGLLAIQTLILAQDHGVDANMQATDLLESYSFRNLDGGSQWHLGTADDSPPTFTPTSEQSTTLAELNTLQAAFDSNARVMDRLAWDLFSIWWKVVSGDWKPSDKLTALVHTTAGRWRQFRDNNKSLDATIKSKSTSHPLQAAKKGASPAFSQRKDPTLLIGGVQAGWPHDYLSQLAIRVDTQTVKASDIPLERLPPGVPHTTRSWQPWRPSYPRKTIKMQPQISSMSSVCFIPPKALGFPLPTVCCLSIIISSGYQVSGVTTQPWVPLFIEWQAEYYHISYDDFSLKKRGNTVRWGIDDGVVVSKTNYDLRTLSGRCLILLQPTLALATAVEQLLANLGTDVPLPPSEITFLKNKDNYNLLPFLSSTLTGLTAHLTTRVAGTHIKPTQRPRGEGLSATAAALEAGEPIGMGDADNDILGEVVGKNTGLTPYGNAVQLDASSGLTQLDLVINALTQDTSSGYLGAFYHMITLSFGELQAADSSYAQYVSSIVGRPLALVNIAMSLELAAYPLQNESNVSGADAYTLLDTSSPKPTPAGTPVSTPTRSTPANTTASEPPKQYSFPVQLGDQQRSYDGLLGFWKPLPAPSSPVSSTSLPQGLEASFDYNKLYTFWDFTTSAKNLMPITPSLLSIAPFLVSPDELQSDQSYHLVDPATQTLRRNKALQAVSALVDPFTAVHAFRLTLPTVSVRLPRGAVEAALTKMTAFVHMGPMLLTGSVPAFNSQYELTSDKDDVAAAPIAGKIGLPALKAGSWRWLQPYPWAEKSGDAGVGDNDGPTQPKYMPLGLTELDSRPRFEKPPYTAVERYLQLSQPLTTANEPLKTNSGVPMARR
ncbi:hypothetical protein B0T25DRAFT_599356 [Lasiosphaeria hispida]|uniref:Uncharacterized protein n=1 Tax=Lasiosphaeria hispida TaxID=260671 RepID=A0AAJ0H4R7_9PEZI|nr:hypothetical protein B0T25DRAFT_599356 [Lasiosphaeria hispida]